MAGLRVYRTTGDKAQGESKMLSFIDAGLQKDGLRRAIPEQNIDGVTVSDTTINPIDSSAHPTLRATLPTGFLGIIGVNQLEVVAASKAALASKNIHGTKNLELSLMLDVSGSMAGSKINDMKTASDDFLDIVLPDGISDDNRRVALVPFSDRVNVGAYVSAATGLPATRQVQTGTTQAYVFSNSSFSWRSVEDCGDRVQSITSFSNYTQAQAEAYCEANFQSRTRRGALQYYTPARTTGNVPVYAQYNLRGCVTERSGSEAYTDAAPGAGSYVGPYAPGYSMDTQYSSSGSCTSYSSVAGQYRELPVVKALTTDKAALKAHINTFGTYAGTAGHVATAWSAYMISPEWNGFWGADVHNVAPYGDPETIKAAVLMTDGEYNSNVNWTSASAQALAICQEMKDKGIIVYTIGFDMSTNPNDPARQMLQQCASPDKYYFPYNGTQLRQAFQEIGNSLVTIVTTNSDDMHVVIKE